MTFGLVHESVIDLYLHILNLADVGTVLDGYYLLKIDPPSEIQVKAENAAESFKIAESNALKLFKKNSIDLQLILFRDRTGKA